MFDYKLNILSKILINELTEIKHNVEELEKLKQLARSEFEYDCNTIYDYSDMLKEILKNKEKELNIKIIDWDRLN